MGDYFYVSLERGNFLKKLTIAISLCLVALLSLVVVGTAAHTFAKSAPAILARPTNKGFHHVCANAPAGFAHCHAIEVMLANRLAPNIVHPYIVSGYHPSDLQTAYKLPSSTAGKGQTVAIVDAFDDPKAEADLGVYRSQFGLSACTTANGCFKKVNQSGGHKYPSPNAGWAEEISLDLDMVSAICPNCHILLVEANNSSFGNLGKSVNEAVKLGAKAVSNSYGGSEFSGETSYTSYYTHAGVAITASAGDNGYGTQIPAAFNTLTAVGGTSLAPTGSGWTETVWNGTGSGCSSFISKPGWQKDSGCSNRAIADVSAVADPNTGVAVYDSYKASGWLIFGGTSVSSPIIASVYALVGNESTIDSSYPYVHAAGNFNDVTQGSNGSCGGSYLCTAGTGYDGPTGLGTPKGIGGF